MLVSRNQKSRSSASRIQNGFTFVRVYNRHQKVNNVSGCSKLSCISLRTHHRKQVFKSITQFFAVGVFKFANGFQKQFQRFWVTIRQIGIIENIPKQLRNVRVLLHALNGLRIQAKHRSEEHTSELQSRPHLVCRLLLEKKKKK